MYAQIIVNQPSRAVDKLYDYKIPDELKTVITPGIRVIIPFSRNNAEKEGFVLRVKNETSLGGNIKSIIRIVSEEPVFKPDMVELIEYMHDRYFATYIDIVNTIIPTGTNIKSLEWWILDNPDSFSGKNETDIRILKYLNDNSGGMDIYSLSSYFDKNIRNRLNLLEKSGVLRREFRHTQDINEKKIRGVRLAVDAARAQEYCEKTRSKIQKRMILMLINNEFISTADIVRFSMGNYSALSSIVKMALRNFSI